MPAGGVLDPGARQALVEVLRSAQGEGLVGPGPVDAHVTHGLGFAEAVGDPGRVALDLGSGAGVPGLVLALARPSAEWILLDGRRRSATFLRTAIHRLGLGSRVRVIEARAEVAARTELRGAIDVVVARGLGPPAATAECAAGFLAVGGRLVVSEPPGHGGARWDATGLRRLEMGKPAEVSTSQGLHFAIISQEAPCPSRFPRRTGLPAKRPLF